MFKCERLYGGHWYALHLDIGLKQCGLCHAVEELH